MLDVKSGIDPKLIKKDYSGKAMKKKPCCDKCKGGKKCSDDKGGLFSKKNKLPFMVKIKMAAAMNKKKKSKK